MKQILQSLKTGQTEVAEVPMPGAGRGQLLIATSRTLVSTGTERMLVEFGRSGWLEKARQQPDKVRMVLEKIKVDGWKPTLDAVLSKLDQPLPLGYCNVGRVVAIGSGVQGFEVGDRVISNGQHAEVVGVPVNLCAKVPDSVADDEAAFTVLASIALQGIRLVQPTLGEAIVVTGLGLIGLLTVQLLKAHGCRVLGIDLDQDKLELARQFGAEVVDLKSGQDPVKMAERFSRGRGVDAVIVTASTQSSEPIHQGALMCRKRGRIVLVGVTGLDLSREDFFKKELTFQVSASYGPGRYDANYEEKGQDYPVGFVRWTEQRNFEAVLDMMADGRLDLQSLISHRFSIVDASKAYELVCGEEPSLGILLSYPAPEISRSTRTISLAGPAAAPPGACRAAAPPPRLHSDRRVAVSFLGAGNYATSVLIPAFKAAGAGLRSVASSKGVGGVHAGRKFGFEEVTTDVERLFVDETAEALVIATRHDSHASFVLQGLRSGKPIFVEKPLCLNLDELAEIQSAYANACSGPSGQGAHRVILMVGFNRRFAPQVQKMKSLLRSVTGPKAMVLTVNAGAVPPDHWTQDPDSGGGRIVGEACHFIDLLRFMADAPITSHRRKSMGGGPSDTATLQLGFADGSVGTIHYFANGPKSYPKERLEVFAEGGVLHLDNFRRLTGYGWPGFRKMNLWYQDKGQRACAQAFLEAIRRGEASPITADEIFEVSRVAIELAR